MVPIGFASALAVGLSRLEAARGLLAEAGYADGFEINLEYPDWNFYRHRLWHCRPESQADLAEVGKATLVPGFRIACAYSGRQGSACGCGPRLPGCGLR